MPGEPPWVLHAARSRASEGGGASFLPAALLAWLSLGPFPWPQLARGPATPHFPGTHRTAIHLGFDVGAVVVAHVLLIGTPEAQSPLVRPRRGVAAAPRSRTLAVVGEVLPGGDTEKPQEGHLHHAQGVAICIRVGKLGVGVGRQRRIRGAVPAVCSPGHTHPLG